MEVCPMSLRVFCELGQSIWLHLLEHPLGGVPGVQVDWPVAAVQSLYSGSESFARMASSTAPFITDSL